MWHRVSSLEEALVAAERMKASGEATWFRGQTRTWPLLSSFMARARPSARFQSIA